ncbi:piggyBac transposable element-derived protein 4-like [Nerophis ophidion]|uniref:piggyBac transposable element-derived protein 4-like n=1 Tax=Nerophis ophidion TaxID=159077 RepID=UPI002AE0986E|nr:piggyBac transposable element-derived protein 4-like [Nerophis ophidion]
MAARYTVEMVLQMLDDGEAVTGLDSESEISDDEDPDNCPGGSGSRPPGNPTEQDQSDSEDSSSVSSEEQNIISNRMSRKGSYWSELPPTQGRTQSHNIIRSRSGPAEGLSITVSPKDAWELFITDDIIQEVMKCTNLEGRRVATARRKEWTNITKDEFMAFIGLTLLAGSEKNWDVSVRELFGSPLHNPMYKATMAVGRFEDIRRTLRFDDKRTRAFRLETDHMAAFRYVWDLFLVNCRQRFIPSDCVTVDEQLVPFRGRCKFLQYMPSKSAKYGLKIFWVCDARIPYAINGIVYTGRQPGEEVQKNMGENIVKQLCGRFRNTGRNITMDNFFTSVPLAQHLLEKDLTIVGTLRLNKPDISPLMKPSKSREVHSTEFGFNNSLTIVSYVRKKAKAVVLLSTMHHDKVVDENSRKKKTEVITFYNKTKGGVDTTDQMVGTYTCKRQTQRWPMVLWYNIIDIATLNSYTFFTAQHPDFKSGITNARRIFLKELSKELVTPHMRSRLEGCPQLQTPIIEAMERCGVTKAKIQPQERSRQGQPKRKRCQICPSNKDRKVNNSCGKCNVPVCNDRSQKQVVCLNCIQ